MLTMLLAMTTGPERDEPPDEKREITENDGIWCYGYSFFLLESPQQDLSILCKYFRWFYGIFKS
jgi:hypothetical protein